MSVTKEATSVKKGNGLRRRYAAKTALLAATSLSGLVASQQIASAATITWSGGAGAGTAWLTTTNWTGGVVPGQTDLAEFTSVGTGNPVGINMNPTSGTNNGPSNQAVGAILMSSGLTRTITNSTSVATGTLTLKGDGSGTLLSNQTVSGTLNIQNGATRAMNVALDLSGNVDVANSGATIAIASNIVNGAASSALTKIGVGTLTLSGQNTFQDGSGLSLTVNAGTLNVANTAGTGVAGDIVVSNSGTVIRSGANITSSVGGSLTLNSGTIIETAGAGTTGTFTVATTASESLSATGATFNFDIIGANQDLLAIGGGNALSLSGSNTINVSGSGFAPGNYTLLTYGSKSGSFTLGTTPSIPGYSFGLTQGATSTILNVTAAASSLTWTGATTGTWATGTTNNWTPNPNFANDDFVTFNDSATGSTNITISGSVAPNTVTFANDAKDYTISGGAINNYSGGPTALVKNGTGTVTLNSANNFTGSVGITGGKLAIGTAAAIGSASGVSITGGATLAATATLSTDRAITSGAGGSTLDSGAGTFTISTGLAGSGVVTKVGSGTLNLSSAANGLSNGIVVNAGKLSLSFADSVGLTGAGSGSAAQATANSGATVEINNIYAGFLSDGLNTTGATAFNVFINDGGTLSGVGDARISGSNQWPTSGNATINAPGVNDRLITGNSVRNQGNGGATSSAVITATGNGVVQLSSGGTSEATSGTQYSGSWVVAMGSTGVLSVGPIQDGGFGEPLNGLGYAAPVSVSPTSGEGYSGSTRPVTVNSGTLAFGADSRNTRGTLALLTSSYRSPLTLAGGAIASTGKQYDTGTGDPTAGDVSATIHANVSTSSGTTSTVKLFDPVAGAAAGGRSISFVTDAGAVEHDGSNTPVSNNLSWGSNSTLVVDATGVSSNYGSFNLLRTTGTVSVDAGATLQINANAQVALGGTMDALSDGTDHVNVVNNSTTGLNVTAGAKNAGGISGTGTTTVAASTSLTATNIRQGALVLTGDGVATVRATGAGGGFAGGQDVGTSKIGTLTLNAGKLDLKDNKLITSSALGTHNGSNYTGVTGLVEQGRNGGFWNGAGITTSMPDATSGSNYTSLAAASAADVLGIGPSATATWGGQTVSGSDSLVMYTYGGDANLSGFVDIDDYGQIDFNASTGGVLTGYFNGDFDYNGIQDIDDYGIIDFVINIQGDPFKTAAGGMSISAVPEPTSIGLIAMGATALLGRRRRAK